MSIFRNNTLNLSIISTILFALFWILYPNRLPMVFETHSYVANLSQNSSIDVIDQFYLLLKTPIYSLFKSVYLNPKNFFLASILIEFFFTILIFIFLYSYSKSSASAFISLIIFGPLFNEVLETLLDIRFLQSIKSLGWGTVNFSIRYFVGLFFLISIFFYLKRKFFLGIIFVSLSLLTHPNSGIFIVGFFILYEIYFFLQKRSNQLRIFLLISTSILCFIPTIINIINLIDIPSFTNISNSYWYNNLIKDEVDDFSILFLFINHPLTLFIHCGLILFTFFYYCLFEKNKNNENDFLIFLILLPLLCLIFFAILELTLSNLNYIFVSFIISLQPGHKILSFSIFPLMFFWSYYLTEALKKLIKLEIFFYILAICVFVIGLYFSINSTKKKIKYFQLLSNIDLNAETYFNVLNINSFIKNNGNPIVPEIYLLEGLEDSFTENFKDKKIFDIYQIGKKIELKPNENFNIKYQDLTALENFNRLIRNNLPPNSGLIIPPYLFHIRDIFPNYKIFFQEHHDGNLAMGNKKIFEEIDKRMKLLIGTNYIGLPPSQQYDLNFTYMRHLYLNRNENDFLNIKDEYNHYNFIITETSHQLNFKIVAKNNHFKIYKMN